MSNSTKSNSPEPDSTERRSFFTRLSAISLGTIVAAFPFAAGWGVVISPWKRGSGQNGEKSDDFVRICSLDSLPANGTPQAFPVMTDTVDAWTRTTNQRVGEVYLSRNQANVKPEVLAFTATCPHLGCAVEFDDTKSEYACPCHVSGFAKDGEKLFGPSLRGLDPLDVEIRGEAGSQEVWVRYQRFRAGIAERISIA